MPSRRRRSSGAGGASSTSQRRWSRSARASILGGMADEVQTIRELHDALRRKRRLEPEAEGDDGTSEAELDELRSYIEVMSTRDHGQQDDLVYEDPPEDGSVSVEGEAPSRRLVVRWPNASSLWRAVRRNINKDGVFLQTDEFPSIDTRVALDIRIAEPPIRVVTSAKVIWVNPRPRGGRPMGMGLKLLWRSKEDRERFKSFLAGDVGPEVLEELA